MNIILKSRKLLKSFKLGMLVLALVTIIFPSMSQVVYAETKTLSVGQYVKPYNFFDCGSGTIYFKGDLDSSSSSASGEVQTTLYSYNQDEKWVQYFFGNNIIKMFYEYNNPYMFQPPYGIMIAGGSGTKEDPYVVISLHDEPKKVESITFNPSEITKQVGDSDFALSPTIAPDDAHYVYKSLEWNSSNPNVVSVDSNGNVTIVGPGTATVTATSKNIHDDTNDDVTGSVTITVEGKSLKISGITANDKTYDGNTNAELVLDNVVLEGLTTGDVVTVTSAVGTFADKNVGNNKTVTISDVVLGGADKDKYTIESVQESTSASITPLEAVLQWGETEFIYDGTAHKPSASVTNLVPDDECTVTVIGDQTEAGTYTATAHSLSNSNYKLPANVTKEFTIKGYFVAVNNGFTWMRGSGDGKPVTFKSNVGDTETFTKNTKVIVDDSVVRLDIDYKKENGSLIVTLKQSFLNTLTDGEHRLTAVFSDGEATATFIVKTPSKPVEPGNKPKVNKPATVWVPKTSDK